MKIGSKYILLAQFLFICLALGGCFNYELEKQKQWWQDQLNASGMVLRCDGNIAPFLMRAQVISLIGDPDMIFKPKELEKNISGDAVYKQRIMNDIWKTYCTVKKRNDSLNCVEGPDLWKSCDDFINCVLLLYDESIHFKKPIPQCAKVGFTCHVYIIENEKVIAYTPSDFWKSLAIKNDNNERKE